MRPPLPPPAAAPAAIVCSASTWPFLWGTAVRAAAELRARRAASTARRMAAQSAMSLCWTQQAQRCLPWTCHPSGWATRHVAGVVNGGVISRRKPALHISRDRAFATCAFTLQQRNAFRLLTCVQTAEPPSDLAAASGDQLRRFLQQAGWPAEAAAALPDHEALGVAVRSARWVLAFVGQWHAPVWCGIPGRAL